MAAATNGVYPMDTLSPMISTFFSVTDAGRGGPGLQTHLPACAVGVTVGGAAALITAVSAAATHAVTAPQLGHPAGRLSLHVVPLGQQVSPLEQHVAFAHGQHPKDELENELLQQVALAGQRV